MLKILLLSMITFLLSCNAATKPKEETLTVGTNTVKIKYMNFTPKEVDKVCLSSKIERLFTIIQNDRMSKKLFADIPAKEYFSEKNKKLRDRIKKLSGQLLMKKHISYKGNHEWNNVIESKYLVLESKKNHIYVMYPLKPITFIILDKSFDDVMASKEYEDINARGLKDWIDMKACIEE